MDQAKTQSVSVSNKNPQILLNKTRNFNSFTTKQMKTIQTELPVESKTLKGQFCDVAKEAKDTRKIAHINPYYSYFPHFYVKELKNAFITYITCLILFFGVLGLLIWALTSIIISVNINDWASLILIPPLVLSLGLIVINANKYYSFRSEAKTINFKDEKTLSINVQKLYKRLKTGHINVNWMAFTAYGVTLLVVFFNFLITYILTDQHFGDWNPAHYDTLIYTIIFITCLAILFLTLILHATLLISNYIRAARIENFYNFMIVSQEDLNIIKKQKNHRDFIIFLIAVGLVGFIGWFVYKIIKRTKTVKVVA